MSHRRGLKAHDLLGEQSVRRATRRAAPCHPDVLQVHPQSRIPATRTAAAGASRKDATGLASSKLTFSEEEDAQKARQLSRCSTLLGARRPEPLSTAPVDRSTDNSFKVLQHSTATRLENITDLFNVPRSVALRPFSLFAFQLETPAATSLAHPHALILAMHQKWTTLMSEFLRSAYAEHTLSICSAFFNATFVAPCWACTERSVGFPRYRETLSHWRDTLELLTQDGPVEPVVVADFGFVNMFGNAEWPNIRVTLRDHTSAACASPKWQHQPESGTVLSSREALGASTVALNRAACSAPTKVLWSSARRAPHA